MCAISPAASPLWRRGAVAAPPARQRCWGASAGGAGRARPVARPVAANTGRAGRLAPAITSPLRLPPPSVCTRRLVPDVARAGGFASVPGPRAARSACPQHRAAPPVQADARRGPVQPTRPPRRHAPRFFPVANVVVPRAGRTAAFAGEGLPRTAGAEASEAAGGAALPLDASRPPTPGSQLREQRGQGRPASRGQLRGGHGGAHPTLRRGPSRSCR